MIPEIEEIVLFGDFISQGCLDLSGNFCWLQGQRHHGVDIHGNPIKRWKIKITAPAIVRYWRDEKWVYELHKSKTDYQPMTHDEAYNWMLNHECKTID